MEHSMVRQDGKWNTDKKEHYDIMVFLTESLVILERKAPLSCAHVYNISKTKLYKIIVSEAIKAITKWQIKRSLCYRIFLSAFA